MHRNIGVWTVELDDDGTLDTCVNVFLRLQPHISYPVRFSSEYAAECRDPDTGCLTEDGFAELAEQAVENAEMSHIWTKI